MKASLSNQICILQYADDLLLYSIHQSPAIACSLLSHSLNLLKTWLDTNGLEISPTKSAAMLFSRMRLPPPINVYFGNNIIPVKKSVKFLGVFLDSKLSGINHCDYICNRCERTVNILRCLSGVWWGAHPFCMKLMYNALIRSILDYGTFLLSPGNVTPLKKVR